MIPRERFSEEMPIIERFSARVNVSPHIGKPKDQDSGKKPDPDASKAIPAYQQLNFGPYLP